MAPPQFDQVQREQVLELVESLAWGDMEQAIYGLEVALALALEATGDAIHLWEQQGEERFGDECGLSYEQIAELDGEWRLAYIARLLHSAAFAYGVSPSAPGRTRDGELVISPTSESYPASPAQLVRGLNDIVYGISPSR
jgi:hypothetical protein